MSCESSKLSMLCSANGFTLWHYQADGPTGIADPGYFNPVAGQLRIGDLIIASGGEKAHTTFHSSKSWWKRGTWHTETVPYTGLYVVLRATAHVTVSPYVGLHPSAPEE